MKLDATKLAGAAVLASMLSAAGPAQAQAPRWQPFVSVTPVYAGVVVAGELRVEDSSGNLLRKEDYDPAPFVAATFIARF